MSLLDDKIISPWDEVSLRLKLMKVVKAEKWWRRRRWWHFPLDLQSFPSKAESPRSSPTQNHPFLLHNWSHSTWSIYKSLPWLKEKLAFYFLVLLVVFLYTMLLMVLQSSILGSTDISFRVSYMCCTHVVSVSYQSFNVIPMSVYVPVSMSVLPKLDHNGVHARKWARLKVE